MKVGHISIPRLDMQMFSNLHNTMNLYHKQNENKWGKTYKTRYELIVRLICIFNCILIEYKYVK